MKVTVSKIVLSAFGSVAFHESVADAAFPKWSQVKTKVGRKKKHVIKQANEVFGTLGQCFGGNTVSEQKFLQELPMEVAVGEKDRWKAKWDRVEEERAKNPDFDFMTAFEDGLRAPQSFLNVDQLRRLLELAFTGAGDKIASKEGRDLWKMPFWRFFNMVRDYVVMNPRSNVRMFFKTHQSEIHNWVEQVFRKALSSLEPSTDDEEEFGLESLRSCLPDEWRDDGFKKQADEVTKNNIQNQFWYRRSQDRKASNCDKEVADNLLIQQELLFCNRQRVNPAEHKKPLMVLEYDKKARSIVRHWYSPEKTKSRPQDVCSLKDVWSGYDLKCLRRIGAGFEQDFRQLTDKYLTKSRFPGGMIAKEREFVKRLQIAFETRLQYSLDTLPVDVYQDINRIVDGKIKIPSRSRSPYNAGLLDDLYRYALNERIRPLQEEEFCTLFEEIRGKQPENIPRQRDISPKIERLKLQLKYCKKYERNNGKKPNPTDIPNEKNIKTAIEGLDLELEYYTLFRKVHPDHPKDKRILLPADVSKEVEVLKKKLQERFKPGLIVQVHGFEQKKIKSGEKPSGFLLNGLVGELFRHGAKTNVWIVKFKISDLSTEQLHLIKSTNKYGADDQYIATMIGADNLQEP